MLSDDEAVRLWRKLFRGQAVTLLTLTEAEAVLKSMRAGSDALKTLSRDLERRRSILGASP
ncbi:hypothetical protein KOR34_37190 [Posidoniimonas corsicana]|uniref:Uncharacterized protein n=2 Tax=Posidoniimonas corsicana TaxID=1938618 RepID=A0A5C5V7D7_9BACT|nr:hypothetical protein KOR34_37190 [Posidoniimonas corsicana]